MTIDYIMTNILSDKYIKSYCKDPDSIAMAEFNVIGWNSFPFAEPIIDVKEVSVRSDCLVHSIGYYEEFAKVVCLINSSEAEDINKILTVRQVVEQLKQFDGNLELCSASKYHDFNSYEYVCAVIDVFDGTNSNECRKCNIPEKYKGITCFVI